MTIALWIVAVTLMVFAGWRSARGSTTSRASPVSCRSSARPSPSISRSASSSADGRTKTPGSKECRDQTATANQ
jgi:hypothetical protein